MKSAAIDIAVLFIYTMYVAAASLASTVCTATCQDTEPVLYQTETVIMTDAALRTYCLIGSLLGAALAAVVWPTQADSATAVVRRAAWKLVASLISGVVFTPMLMRYMEWRLDADYVFGVAGLVSCVSVVVLADVGPYALEAMKKAMRKWIDGKIGGTE